MFNWAMEPLTKKPSIYARKVANDIDSPTSEGGYGRGMLAGMAEGAGDLISDMSSPFGIASMLAPGALGLLGRGAKAIGSTTRTLPTAITAARGINPGILPSELIASGSEGVYNIARHIPNTARSLEDLAYEIVRNPDKIKSSIGGDFNLAKAMEDLHRARGR